MRFGAHIYLWTDRWSAGTLSLVGRARSLGLDCLEIAVGEEVDFDAKSARRAAASAGIELILSPGGLWPADCDISDDDAANRQKGLAWHRRWIDAAAESGAVAYTGAIYGHPGTVRRRRASQEEWNRTAENLHLLAEYAHRQGVRLVIEPMSHFRTHLVNRPDQAVRLIELAGHPNLGILLDTYHMVTELRDYAEAVRTVGQYLWGIHACENDRGVPGGGLVPWAALGKALRSRSSLYLLLESYNSSIGDFAVRRAMFHDVCPDGDEFVRAGLQFLRSWVAGSGAGKPAGHT